MELKKYLKLTGLLKFLEFGALAFLTYYVTIKNSDINIWVLISVYILLFIFWIIEFAFSNIYTKNLDLLVKHFYEQCYFESGDDVRITIHKKIDNTKYKQYINYYPIGGMKGKVYKIEQGIVRYAFKNSKKEFSENFKSDNEKIEKLINVYNYRKEEAEERIKDGKYSYYCCPIVIDEKIWGVVYMSSKQLNRFPDDGLLLDSQLSKNVKAFIKMIENEVN
jgi:hypothetical protein